jgi:hypothetical protein
MAAAFRVSRLEEIPAIHRANARLFITLFDAGVIPLDVARKACGLLDESSAS